MAVLEGVTVRLSWWQNKYAYARSMKKLDVQVTA
jgi:hypothetical protein